MPPGLVEDLPRYAREAGFEVAGVSGFFSSLAPEVGFDLHATTIAAARERATTSGVATAREVDDLIGSLRAAQPDRHEWVTSPFFLDLTLRKP